MQIQSMLFGETGETCKVNGIYYCLNHQSVRMLMSSGAIFAPCPVGDFFQKTTWVLLQEKPIKNK